MSIKRLQSVPGLQRPMVQGKDVYSHVVTSTRKKMIFIAGQLARDVDGERVGKGNMRVQLARYVKT